MNYTAAWIVRKLLVGCEPVSSMPYSISSSRTKVLVWLQISMSSSSLLISWASLLLRQITYCSVPEKERRLLRSDSQECRITLSFQASFTLDLSGQCFLLYNPLLQLQSKVAGSVHRDRKRGTGSLPSSASASLAVKCLRRVRLHSAPARHPLPLDLMSPTHFLIN